MHNLHSLQSINYNISHTSICKMRKKQNILKKFFFFFFYNFCAEHALNPEFTQREREGKNRRYFVLWNKIFLSFLCLGRFYSHSHHHSMTSRYEVSQENMMANRRKEKKKTRTMLLKRQEKYGKKKCNLDRKQTEIRIVKTKAIE